jgi:hypothetical protein
MARRITFGHGARHIVRAGLRPGEVERAIEANVLSAEITGAAPGLFAVRTIRIGELRVEYHAFVVGHEHIHIGTYFVSR